MAFTIEYAIKSGGTCRRAVVGRFEDSTLGKLFSELGVDLQRWQLWNQSLRSGTPMDVVPGRPQLSLLASADEGNIRFMGRDLQDLRDECECVKTLIADDRARAILADLEQAARRAIDGDGEVNVHPFGGC